MTKFETSKCEGVMIKVPEQSGFHSTSNKGIGGIPLFTYDPDINTIEGNWTDIRLPDGNWEYIGLSKELTEEQCDTIVHKGGLRTYKDYVYASVPHKRLDEVGLFNALLEMKFKTARESFNSLLQSLNLDLNKNYAIILKTP